MPCYVPCCIAAAVFLAFSPDTGWAMEGASPERHRLSDEWTAVAGSPVVVALSKPGETRWGWHQFPALSVLPDGGILCAFSCQNDAASAYGNPLEAYVSRDLGRTWDHVKPGGDVPALAAPHCVISKVCQGEYLLMPARHAFDVSGLLARLPEPLAESAARRRDRLYEVRALPDALRKYVLSIDAYRWSPNSNSWGSEKVMYDGRGALARCTCGENEGDWLIPSTWFEHRLLMADGELLYADYRQLYTEPDGLVPRNRAVSLMVSKDNGHSFCKRSTVAINRTGNLSTAEPCLSRTSDGGLACVMRRQESDWKGLMPLAITFSRDRGKTWDPPVSLGYLGVFPNIDLLENQVLVLSYGRPGVHLRFSLDGTGSDWTKPVTLRKGDPDSLLAKTCGYTSILPVSSNEFLIAYSDFEYMTEPGATCKAILVRRVALDREDPPRQPKRPS